MIVSWLVQKAVFAALSGEITGPVYDEVPEDATDALYTVIGETTEVPDDTHEEGGSDETILLHVWHRDEEAPSSGPLKQEMAAIDELLHHQTLSLDGGGTVFLTRTFVEVLKDESEPAEVWRHGVMRYRARTLEAP